MGVYIYIYSIALFKLYHNLLYLYVLRNHYYYLYISLIYIAAKP